MYGSSISVSLWSETSDGDTSHPNRSKMATDLSPEDYIRINYANMMMFVEKLRLNEYNVYDAKLAHSERTMDIREAVRFGKEAQLEETEVLKMIMESH